MSEKELRAKSSKVRVSAEVKLHAKNPIPLEYSGVAFSAVTNHFYIPFLEGSDDFFNTLLEARLLSTSQHACVSTKTNYTIGQGLEATKGEKENKVWKEFAKAVNGRRQGINSVVRKAVDTFLTFGNAPIEIVRGQVGKQRFIYLYCHNQLDCRLGKPNDENEVTEMIYSRHFRRRGTFTDATKTRAIPLYKKTVLKKDSVWLKDKKTGVERTAIWLKNEIAGYDHYGLPSSISSIHHQKTEHDAVRYNLDNLENNMIVGGVVVLQGNLSPDESNRIGRQIVNQHTGPGKRGRVAVISSEEGIDNSKFLPMDTRKEGSYKELDATAQSKIIFSNEWDAVLAGLQDSAALGKGAGYLEEIYEQKMATVIRPLQAYFMENLIIPYLELADEWLGTRWSQAGVGFIPTQVVNKSNSPLMTTPEGIRVFLEIVKAVAEGYYPLKAAIKLVSKRFGMTELEAAEQIGNPSNVPA